MRRRVSLSDAATGKSRAEVVALRHLREAYDALARLGASLIMPGTPGRRTRSVETLSSSVFDQWLELETLGSVLDTDTKALQREIESTLVRTTTSLQLPADGFDTLDPKLLVLSDVLGHDAFANYSRDLFTELATLRQRVSLYDDRLKHFQDQVQLRCIGAHHLREVVSHTEWLDMANASLGLNDTNSPLLVSHFPILMQHVSPPTGECNMISIRELLQLLKRLPPARERLVSLCFEQVGDVRRGSGLIPPPEGIRPHKLAALVKQSHANALCSVDERDRVLIWLQHGWGDDGSVSQSAFLSFHTTVSDIYIAEDAEFVAFLMRIWAFELPSDLGVANVVADYEARCQEVTNRRRKVEIFKKIEHVRAVIPSKLTSLRFEVGRFERISIQQPEQLDQFAMYRKFDTSTLQGLRILQLNGLQLIEFPVFVVRLPLLEELELRDNQLRGVLPLEAIGTMQKLQKLVLSDNYLTDHSFVAPPDPVWNGLTCLRTLELSRNQLTIIPRVVVELMSLEHLHLATNQLRDRGIALDVATQWHVQGSPRLHTFDVHDNELQTLPDVVFSTGQSTLEVCDVHANHLTDLPTSVELLERLEDADFSHNRLTQLGTGDWTSLITRCNRFRELRLHHNHLKQLPIGAPASSLSIIGLQAIRCHKNAFRTLPSLTNLAFLACEELDLRINGLQEIPETFFPAFPVLRICRLQHNAIPRLPDAITSCRRLEVLEMYDNKLVYVPSSLVNLHNLTLLNLRENQLTTIPTEWHAFAQSYESKPRALELLYLQRNPLRNKVLQTLVDGASGGTKTVFKSNDVHICEMYVRKLIDSLKESVPVQTLARAVDVEAPEENQDNDDDLNGRKRRRWKGRARFVVQYVETQMTRRGHGFMLSMASFHKLLQKLLVTSTTKELRLISNRFAHDDRHIDGWAFLCGVEAVGMINTLPAMDPYQAPGRSKSVHKPVDSVASILQYLRVAHDQKSKGPDVSPAPVAPVKVVGSAAPSAKASSTRRPQSAKALGDKPAQPKRTDCPSGRENTAAHQRELERQRQRIQVLEQQLLDQRLLRLVETKSSIAELPAPLSSRPPEGNSSMLIHVKQLNPDSATMPELVVIALPPEATVLQLKQAITKRLGVAVERQILVARTTTSGRDHERLRDDASLAVYHQPSSLTSRWPVSLIVSDKVHMDWVKWFSCQRQKAQKEALPSQSENLEK